MPIDLIDTIKPKNGGSFPMVEAEDVVVGKGTADEKRLPEALAEARKVAAVDTSMPGTPADDHVPSTQLLKEQLDGKLSLTGGTLTGALTVNAAASATSFKIPQGEASHCGEVVSIKNGPTMAGAVGIVYERVGVNPSGNTRKRFMGVSGGDYDTRLYIGDGDIPNAESGLTTVFGLHLPDDRTWARHDLWFTDKVGDAQGTRTWWGLVQDGDELRIVKDKGTPKAYLPLSGGTVSGDIKFTENAAIVMANGTKVFYQDGASSHMHAGYIHCNYFPICELAGGSIDNYFAAKKDVYSKGEVDGKISEALGSIKTALAAI